MRGWVGWGVMALLVITGCSSSQPAASPATPTATPRGSASPAARPVDPLLLVGSWTVLTPAGTPTSTHLRIGDDLELSPPCGALIGTWSANASGMFLAETDGGSSACFTPANGGGRAPSWLTSATRFAVDGPTRVLLDGSGHVVAKLTPGRGLYHTPNLKRLRARLATAPPLPSGLTPVTATTLAGRWLPAPVRHYPSGTPAVSFAADRSWSGSDGCNAQGERWLVGTGGALVTTSGPSTLIGCAGVPVGAWVSTARRAGFDGGVLVLLDGSGREIGRLVRARSGGR